MFSGTGLQAGLQFAVTITLARLLTPHDFGVVSAAMVVITFTTIFSLIGVGPAIIQHPKLNDLHIRTGFLITVLLSFLFMIGMFLMSPLIATFFEIPELTLILKVLSIMFVTKGFAVISESLVQRKLKFKLLAGINIVSYLTYALVGIVLALIGFNYWALVMAQITQSIVKSILLIVTENHSMKFSLHKESAKELLFFGGGYTIARISNHFALQADNLVVGKWLGANFLGLYNRAYQLMVMPANLFGQVLDKVLFPLMAKVQNKKEPLSQSFRVGITSVAFFTIPVSLFIFIYSKEIVLILFGKRWLDLMPALQILSLGLLFRTGYKISDSLARATGAVYRRAWRQVIYAIMVFFGSWIGHHWGITGVSTGVLLAIVINYILMTHLSMKFINLTVVDFIKIHFPGLFTGILVVLSVFITSKINIIYNLNDFVLMFISFVLFATFVFLLFLLKIDQLLGNEVVWIKNRVLSMIRKK